MVSGIVETLHLVFGLIGIAIVCVGSYKVYEWFIAVKVIMQTYSEMESNYKTLEAKLSVQDEKIALLEEDLGFAEDQLSIATEKMAKRKARISDRMKCLLKTLHNQKSTINSKEKEISALRSEHLAIQGEFANLTDTHRILEQAYLDQAITHQRIPNLDIIERFLCKDYNTPEFAEFLNQYEEEKSRNKLDEAISGEKPPTPRSKNLKYGQNTWICPSAAHAIFGEKGLTDLMVVLRYEESRFNENPQIPKDWKVEPHQASTYRSHYVRFRGKKSGNRAVFRDVEESTLGDQLRELATHFISNK